MKTKLLFFSLLMLAMGGSLFAQNSASGNITATSTNCTSVASSCVWESVLPPNAGTSTVNLAGTFSETLLVELSNNGGSTWSTAATLSAAGTTTYSTNGFTDIRVRCSAFTSGTAVVSISTGLLQVQSVVSSSSSSSSSSSPSSVGPVINVTNAAYAGGASSSLADNNAAFTAAAAAAVTAVTVGTGVPTFKTSAFANCPATCTSQAVTVNVSPGDTVVVHVTGVNNARTVTATDSGGNSYYQIYVLAGAGFNLNTLATNPSGARAAATSVTVSISGGALAWGAIVSTYSNVGSYRYWPIVANANGTTQTQTVTTNFANDLVVTGYVWFSGGADAASQSGAGNLRNTFPATASIGGGAIVTQSAATAGTSLSNTITIAVTSQTTVQSLELRGISDVIPTVYIPYSATPYQYSGGLSFTLPATLECQMGAVLAYTGSAHAVDLGPTGLAFATSQKQYNVKGCMFTNGWQMTEGIYIQPFVEWPGISYSTFYNFGNATSHMITSSQENWDVEVGPQNRFITDDGQPRPLLLMNQNHVSQNSFLRFHDNAMWCLPQLQNLGCDASQAGVGIVTDGSTNRIYHNNMMFWNPAIEFICSNNPPCENNQADQNQIEAPATGSSSAPIRFDNQSGLLVTQNTILMHSTGASAVGPLNGSSTLAAARINFNTISQNALATPLVAQNNVVGQGGNQSFGNACSTTLGTGYLPCALLHTTGGNISSWGSDNYPSCTLVTGTCTVTLSQNYGVLPKCTGSWNGAGALAGILKVVPTAGNPNTVVVTSSNGADTAGVQLACSSGDGQ